MKAFQLEKQLCLKRKLALSNKFFEDGTESCSCFEDKGFPLADRKESSLNKMKKGIALKESAPLDNRKEMLLVLKANKKAVLLQGKQKQ